MPATRSNVSCSLERPLRKFLKKACRVLTHNRFAYHKDARSASRSKKNVVLVENFDDELPMAKPMACSEPFVQFAGRLLSCSLPSPQSVCYSCVVLSRGNRG